MQGMKTTEMNKMKMGIKLSAFKEFSLMGKMDK